MSHLRNQELEAQPAPLLKDFSTLIAQALADKISGLNTTAAALDRARSGLGVKQKRKAWYAEAWDLLCAALRCFAPLHPSSCCLSLLRSCFASVCLRPSSHAFLLSFLFLCRKQSRHLPSDFVLPPVYLVTGVTISVCCRKNTCIFLCDALGPSFFCPDMLTSGDGWMVRCFFCNKRAIFVCLPSYQATIRPWLNCLLPWWWRLLVCLWRLESNSRSRTVEI